MTNVFRETSGVSLTLNKLSAHLRLTFRYTYFDEGKMSDLIRKDASELLD
jgi:hypothetical protein